MEKCRLDYKLASLVFALVAVAVPGPAQNSAVWPGTIMSPSMGSNSTYDSRATLNRSSHSLRTLPERLTVQILVLENGVKKLANLVVTPLAIDELKSSECAVTGTTIVGFANVSATGKEISHAVTGADANRVFTFDTEFELEGNVPFYVKQIHSEKGRVYVEFLGTQRPSVSSFFFRNRESIENQFSETKPTFFRTACPTQIVSGLRKGDLILKQPLEIVGHSEIFGFRFSKTLDLKIENLTVAPLHASDFNERARSEDKEICLLQLPTSSFPQVYQNGLISEKLRKVEASAARNLPTDSVYYEVQCPQ